MKQKVLHNLDEAVPKISFLRLNESASKSFLKLSETYRILPKVIANELIPPIKTDNENLTPLESNVFEGSLLPNFQPFKT